MKGGDRTAAKRICGEDPFPQAGDLGMGRKRRPCIFEFVRLSSERERERDLSGRDTVYGDENLEGSGRKAAFTA